MESHTYVNFENKENDSRVSGLIAFGVDTSECQRYCKITVVLKNNRYSRGRSRTRGALDLNKASETEILGAWSVNERGSCLLIDR